MPGRIVDHVVLIAGPDDHAELSATLRGAGFRLGDVVSPPGLGLLTHMLPLAGGGFVELSHEITPGSSPFPAAFVDTPRIVRIGYHTDDAAADVARFQQVAGADATIDYCVGGYRRGDGSQTYSIGVSPVRFTAETSFFLQERRLFPVPFPQDADTAPTVVSVSVEGQDAARWHTIHRDWFALPPQDGALLAGDTVLDFTDGVEPGLGISMTLGRCRRTEEIPLARGSITLSTSDTV